MNRTWVNECNGLVSTVNLMGALLGGMTPWAMRQRGDPSGRDNLRSKQFNCFSQKAFQPVQGALDSGKLEIQGINFLDSCVAHHHRRTVVGWRAPYPRIVTRTA